MAGKSEEGRPIMKSRRMWFTVLFCLLDVLVTLDSVAAGERSAGTAMPMPIEFENTINHRWLDKAVLKSRLLDDMEQSANWSARRMADWSHQGFGEMTFTKERAKDGQGSVRLTSPTKAEKSGPTLGRPFGEAVIKRNFAGEDWSDYNRLSFWVWPTLQGFRVISLCLELHNDGSEKVPDVYGRHGRNYVILQGGQWNHVVWEIAHLGRDKVTAVEFCYRLQGNEPGAATSVCYDFDHLELQKVEADHFEGWNVAPGQIAYSHTGYPVSGSKTAIASGLDVKEFSVIDTSNQKTVFSKEIESKSFRVGRFQIMDFSEVNQPGSYIIQTGDVKTRPFQIRGDVWRDTIWKTINFFYCERCGAAVPGIHDLCHCDWLCTHGDKKIVINGGWHDAGDLSQGLVNTAEGVYAMFSLARQLQTNDQALSRRLIEEACWGLDWILKTRFGDGFRCTWATMDFWTDGVMGTVDDVAFEARNNPFENFLAASAEALASGMLKEMDPPRSRYCLQAAEEDFKFAVDKLQNPNLELAAAGLNAALDLYEVTGRQSYADSAAKFASVILECQQQSVPDWGVPLTGFFYTSTRKDRILHYSHRGHEQAPIVGLVRLCELLREHPDWMKWYAAIVLYCQYYKTIADYTAPYYMLPASIYRIDESDRPTFAEQVRNGVKLSDEYYLRLFPVWFDFRGNNGTVLSQTKGLAAAARLRTDGGLMELCQKQLQWVIGRNPFCQSTMYGEGYDYAPQYTAMSGDMVGSLPVGIQSRFNGDAPYWPADNCYNYKEVWVHPSARWLWLMCELLEPGVPQREDFTLSQQTSADGSVSITLATSRQEGGFALRTWNLEAGRKPTEKTEQQRNQRIVTWQTKMTALDKPWVAVVVVDNDLSQCKDISGMLPKR